MYNHRQRKKEEKQRSWQRKNRKKERKAWEEEKDANLISSPPMILQYFFNSSGCPTGPLTTKPQPSFLVQLSCFHMCPLGVSTLVVQLEAHWSFCLKCSFDPCMPRKLSPILISSVKTFPSHLFHLQAWLFLSTGFQNAMCTSLTLSTLYSSCLYVCFFH